MANVRLLTDDERKEVFARQIRASGWLYMVAYKKLVGEFGFDGRTTIRRWMRTWGIWRGEQTRKGHHALGLEISMENLMLNWDSDAAATPELKAAWKCDPACRFTPGCVKIITPPGHYSCPQHELWAENDFLFDAHVHCDEFHVKYVQGYHPEATVVIPECMTKKDEACHFTFLRDPEAKDPPHLPLYEGEDPLKDWKADTDEERQFTLLGPDEADFAKGSISINSPVGRALLGHEVGDEVTIDIPRGRVTYEITEIEFHGVRD